ncbi:MAG: TlpA family protein disulfide reductase [Chloroflexota bacterium]|nr:TlpA family protein disulfide reductase [Chloroflexota bacterium]
MLAGAGAGLVVAVAAVVTIVSLLPERPPVANRGTDGARNSSTAPPETTSPSVSPTVTPVATSPSPDVGLRVGDRAPALAVAQLGGGQIDLQRLRGRALWVNFTATWCPPCRDELSLLERFQGSLGTRVTVLVIDVREPEDAIASLATQLGLTLPIGLDTDGRAQRDWGAYALPVHYWLDADGRVRGFVYGGAGPEQFLEGVRTVVPDARVDLGP